MQKGIAHLLVLITVVAVIVVVIGGILLSGTLKKQSGVPIAPGGLLELPGQQGQTAFNNPLATHDTYITFSQDSKTWSAGALVKEGASVPELVQLTTDVGSFGSGDLLIYFVDASTLVGHGTEGIRVYHSEDLGKNWEDEGLIEVSNKPNKGAVVDPAIVQSEDGTLRLYYFGSETTSGDPASAEGKHSVYSATSSDGINWEIEAGARFADERLTDPEVIFYNNRWYMYYSVGPETKLATSGDGLSFSATNMTGGNVGGVPGAVEVSGGVRLYGCSQGISTALSTNGTNFSKDGTDIIKSTQKPVVCDPSVVKLADGRYAMAYKIAEANEMGGPPQGNPPKPPGY
jgi:hypothetical protein